MLMWQMERFQTYPYVDWMQTMMTHGIYIEKKNYQIINSKKMWMKHEDPREKEREREKFSPNFFISSLC